MVCLASCILIHKALLDHTCFQWHFWHRNSGGAPISLSSLAMTIVSLNFASWTKCVIRASSLSLAAHLQNRATRKKPTGLLSPDLIANEHNQGSWGVLLYSNTPISPLNHLHHSTTYWWGNTPRAPNVKTHLLGSHLTKVRLLARTYGCVHNVGPLCWSLSDSIVPSRLYLDHGQ